MQPKEAGRVEKHRSTSLSKRHPHIVRNLRQADDLDKAILMKRKHFWGVGGEGNW